MAQTSYPHSGSPILTEAQWANLARHWYSTGVLRDELNQFANNTPSGLTIGIQSGRSFIDGVWHESDATETKTVGSNSGGGSARTDRIALKLDRTTKTIDIVVVPGTVGAGTPALTNTTTEVYSKLFRVTLNTGSSSINTVVDEREYSQPYIVRRLGIGNATPAAALDVTGDGNDGVIFRGNYAHLRLIDGGGTAQCLVGLRPDVTGNSEDLAIYSYNGDIRVIPAGTESVVFPATSSDVSISVLDGDIDLQNGVLRFDPSVTTAGATAGGGASIPATVRAFLKISVGGIEKKIPYYDA